MKKLFLVLSSFLILACGESKKNQETVTVSGSEASTGKLVYNGAKRDAKFKNDEVTSVYDNYNKLKTALVNTDSEAAQNAAEEMISSMEAVEVEADLKEAAQAIANTNDINKQRVHFKKLTSGVKTFVEENISGGTLYYQYCPMAFDGKGAYWISNEKKVYNPYFGDVMLNCGTVSEEIN
ncbi:DUF3347 domain-containing protein [Leeuwenhoekiella sp. W20_SRS_FM14]|uniref:DUF3347 domain-containing protein n=1 Tax=Leeuwenhoekiella sp. W20_SRS_FM14 TaxID=3240270 RepID=UPI003F96EC7F